MQVNELSERDIVFGRTSDDLTAHLVRVLHDDNLQRKLQNFSIDLEKVRTPHLFVKEFANVVFN
jgi:hypothetical protein